MFTYFPISPKSISDTKLFQYITQNIQELKTQARSG